MRDTDFYMTAALVSFVSAAIAGLATLAGPHWQTGSLIVGLFALIFVLTFRAGLVSASPRPRMMDTMEINLTRLRKLEPGGAL